MVQSRMQGKRKNLAKLPRQTFYALNHCLAGRIAPSIEIMRRGRAIAVVAAATVASLAVNAQVRSGTRFMATRPAVSGVRGQPVRTTSVTLRPRMVTTPSRVVVNPNRFGRSGVIINPRFRQHHRFFFSSGCFGPFFNPFLCQQAFFAPPVIWPSPIFWPDTSRTYTAQQQTPAVQYESDPELRAELERLTQEVEMLRQEQQAAKQPKIINVPETPTSTVLIFGDGHRVKVQNYGIVGQTLWIFSERNARKVPLADLDLKATQLVNAERGVEFLDSARR